MRVIDTHCDALLKLWEDRRRDFTSNDIETNIHRLREGDVWIQCFAIFVEPTIKSDQKFQVVLDQIQLFFEKVITPNPHIKHIKSWEDILQLEENEIGAILTLEGVDPIGDDLERLKLLYHLGVMSVGLTWNQANLCADGIGEPRGAGLTSLGRELISLNNEHRILTDVSHISEAGFWDVLETAHYPIATHSNAKSLCSHRRNLTDEQLKAMIKKQAPIGVVFHPYFLENEGSATIASIVNHIEHVCSLGGKQQICFGSDFDGIPSTVSGLHHAGDYQNLINELLKHFTEEEVRGFAYQNFLNHLPS